MKKHSKNEVSERRTNKMKVPLVAGQKRKREVYIFPSFSLSFTYTYDKSFLIRKLGNYSPMVFQWRKNKVK